MENQYLCEINATINGHVWQENSWYIHLPMRIYFSNFAFWHYIHVISTKYNIRRICSILNNDVRQMNYSLNRLINPLTDERFGLASSLFTQMKKKNGECLSHCCTLYIWCTTMKQALSVFLSVYVFRNYDFKMS